MALTNNGFKSDGKLVFLTPRKKNKAGEEVKPFFSVGRLVNDKIEQTEEEFTSVSGDLIRVEVKEKTFNDNVLKEAVFYLRDNDANETYRLGLTFSMPTRGLFNSLASLVNYGGLSVDIYENKKGYETYALKQNGEKTSWKYELDKLPKPDEILDKKGKLVKRDFSDLDSFFEKELLAIAAKINKTPSTSTTTASGTPNDVKVVNTTSAKTVSPAIDAAPAAKEDLDEDVPF